MEKSTFVPGDLVLVNLPVNKRPSHRSGLIPRDGYWPAKITRKLANCDRQVKCYATQEVIKVPVQSIVDYNKETIKPLKVDKDSVLAQGLAEIEADFVAKSRTAEEIHMSGEAKLVTSVVKSARLLDTINVGNTLMNLWNFYVEKSLGKTLGKCNLPRFIEDFLKEHKIVVLREETYRDFMLHICSLEEVGLISSIEVKSIVESMTELNDMCFKDGSLNVAMECPSDSTDSTEPLVIEYPDIIDVDIDSPIEITTSALKYTFPGKVLENLSDKSTSQLDGPCQAMLSDFPDKSVDAISDITVLNITSVLKNAPPGQLSDKFWHNSRKRSPRSRNANLPCLNSSRARSKGRNMPGIRSRTRSSDRSVPWLSSRRRTANENDLKVQAQSQTNDILSTCNLCRKKVKEPEIGMNWESSSVKTGIGKVGGKLKSSSWILKKSANDAFTFEYKDFDERSCMSEPSSNTARRSKRTRKPPYWRRLEAKTNEMAARQIDQLDDKAARQIDELSGVRHEKGIKSKSSYRKATPAVSSEIQGTRIDDGNKVKVNGQKLNKNSLKNPSTVFPSMSRSKNGLDEHSTRAQIFTSMEILPRRQMRSQATENQQARLPDTDTDSTENEETVQNSNLVVPSGRTKANMKSGTKSDIMDCVIVKDEPTSENPRDWTVAQTVAAIVRMEPDIAPKDINAIRDHKINGKVLLKLSFHDLVSYCQVKVGSAMMLSTLIEKWKNESRQFE